MPSAVFSVAFCALFSVAVGVVPNDGAQSSNFNYKCKNASSDWPMPCQRPRENIKNYKFKSLPITAWWGPSIISPGGDKHITAEFEAYIAAGFNMVMVSDRGGDRCQNESDRTASWQFIKDQLKMASEHNVTALIDTYRCMIWGDKHNTGGYFPGGGSGFWNRGTNKKITLPEVKWISNQLKDDNVTAGLLITDDGVDLTLSEYVETEWMSKATPNLWPWINQCGDGSEWLARAGTPYLVPELYGVQPGGNATQMAAKQTGDVDDWQDKGNRFGLDMFPLINTGNYHGSAIRSVSLTQFQAYSALAIGSKGINWYCWGGGIWNGTISKPSPIYQAVADANNRVTGWSDVLLSHEIAHGVFHSG